MKKVVGSGASAITTYSIWEGGRVIAEYSNAPAGAGGVKYYLADRLSTRMVMDSSGAVIGTQDHVPYGEEAGTTTGQTEKHRFTNYERDSESGTDYAVNRQYAMATGRFMRPDPVSGTISNPQSLNRYTYTTNDPINLVDPQGLDYISSGDGAGYPGVTFGLYVFLAVDDDRGNRVWTILLGFVPLGSSNGFFTGEFNLPPTPTPQGKQQSPCPPNGKALLQVGELLSKAGFDSNEVDVRLSQSGKGFLLTFEDPQQALNILGNKNLFAGGGSYGSQEHQQELRQAFGDVKGGSFADFRSFNGGNTTLGDRSLQVVLYRDKDKNIIGAYADTDRFNFRQDAIGFLGHTFIEYLPYKFLRLFGYKRKCA